MAPPEDTGPGVIRVLSGEIIDLIAAGEVVERPASVVKELVENAIDAGAQAVEVHLEGGGLGRIIVSDDGCGMARGDAERAFLRHATSKLRAAEDLFNIVTLGFRGEALSSIGAVSRMTVSTRRTADAAGTRVRVEAGALVGIEDAGLPAGTTVDVRELFYNTPARRKFMRSAATEQAHASDAALRVVLGARRGALAVVAGERRLVDVPDGGDPLGRARAALGARAGTLYEFQHESDGVRVSGFITAPEVDRADAKGLWFFVNGRYVRDRMLQRAVLDGYRSMTESGRYPIALVYVDLAPQAVDVNVHPQKLEVRFGDGNAVFRAVSRALAGTLARTPWVGGGGGVRTPPAGGGRLYVPSRAFVRGLGGSRLGWAGGALAADGGLGARGAMPGAPLSAGGAGLLAELPGVARDGYFAGLRPVGQALGLYLVCEGADDVVFIDQHAAHERIAFERLRRAAAQGEVARQRLLFPEGLDLPPRHVSLVEEHAASLVAYGFEIEPVAPARFAVRAVPAALEGADARRLVQDLVEELAALDDAGLGLTARDAQARILSRCACHAVVRAGDRLGPEEIAALLAALDEVDFGAACPHGRPVYHRLSRRELDRLFHRV